PPGPLVGVPVSGVRSGEARQDPGAFPPQFPDPAVQAHLVHPGDSARVVVVLFERLWVCPRAEDRDTAGRVGVLVDEPLGQEEPALQPFERGLAAASDGRGARPEESGLKRGFRLPLADQHVQAVERTRPLGRNVGRDAVWAAGSWLGFILWFLNAGHWLPPRVRPLTVKTGCRRRAHRAHTALGWPAHTAGVERRPLASADAWANILGVFDARQCRAESAGRTRAGPQAF